MIKLQNLQTLKEGKNLLAFSAGVDSSALFFLLIENGISFDIAIVDYALREEAKEEIEYAKRLADRYDLQLYIIEAPKWESNFESKAREFRYKFFGSLIDSYSYTNLLTAHQLNDQLEWFLMRLSRGAGVGELLGLHPSTTRYTSKDTPYTLLRPLLESTKDNLLEYLHHHNHHYFVDSSNHKEIYERNLFRARWSDPLIKNYSKGIARSFGYLREEKELLEDDIETLFSQDKLRVVKLNNPNLKARASAILLKELGYLLSAPQRAEIQKSNSVVVGGKWAIVYQDSRLYISPFLSSPMPKKFKELCRVSSMPIKIRAYCYESGIEPIRVMKI
jgi:tRNA(Ile)-lysidine synthase